MTDIFMRRVATFFHENETAHSFLSQDGDGGYLAAIVRMTTELEELRKAARVELELRSQLRPPRPGSGEAA